MPVQQTSAPAEKLRRRLSSIGSLPTPPVVFTQISNVMNDPMTSVKQVAEIMSEDPAMSARVLRLANSAYFGVRHEISHIKQAVLVLGLDAIKALVLSSAVFDMFKDASIDADYQERFWRHSLATGLAARLLAKRESLPPDTDSEVAFSAGLLHDIGKLIFCCFMPEDHNRIREFADSRQCSDCLAEEEVIGYTHALVGALLAESWKLPQVIRTAIAEHHSPPAIDIQDSLYPTLVGVADYLSRKTFEPDMLKNRDGYDDAAAAGEQLGFTPDVLDELGAQLVEHYSRSSTFMQMAVSA